MINKLGLMIITMIMLTGCLEKNILDDVRLATAIGYELAEDDQYKITAVVPIFMPDKSTANETFTVTSSLSSEAKKLLSMTSSKPFVSGKIEVIVIEEDVARKGILPILDGYFRDPSVGSRTFIVVTKGDVAAFLNGQYSTQDNGMFISDMVNRNIQLGPLPKSNLHLFFNRYYAEARSPYMPILIKDENRAKITGLALYKGDKMVEKLDQKMLPTFRILSENKSRQGLIELEMDNEEEASIYKVKSIRNFEITNVTDKPEITIHIKLEATLQEYSGVKINKQILDSIKMKAEKQLTEQATTMIKRFQELGIDPLGIGEHVRRKNRNWSLKHWIDIYPTLNIQIKSNVTLTETGIAE